MDTVARHEGHLFARRSPLARMWLSRNGSAWMPADRTIDIAPSAQNAATNIPLWPIVDRCGSDWQREAHIAYVMRPYLPVKVSLQAVSPGW
jgi:hypothetical protein